MSIFGKNNLYVKLAFIILSKKLAKHFIAANPSLPCVQVKKAILEQMKFYTFASTLIIIFS